MKCFVLLSMLLVLECVHIRGAPVDQVDMEQGSCTDAQALGAAEQALNKINQDRSEGYVFSLRRLSNVHMTKHGETGFVFYLTMDVLETTCSVLSRKSWKECEQQSEHKTLYGQCKAAIYMNKVHRVVRLYKYDCVVRPVPSDRMHRICPDCPSHTSFDDEQVQETVARTILKFNRGNSLPNYFSLLNISRANSGWGGMAMYYNVELTMQETTCAKNGDAPMPNNCPLMESEFAQKGFCKSSNWGTPTGNRKVNIECELYEPKNETNIHHPEGTVRVLPALGKLVTMPSFPDVPVGGPEVGVTLPLKPDPQIPGETEPTILPSPTSLSAQCEPPTADKNSRLLDKLFAEDQTFRVAA